MVLGLVIAFEYTQQALPSVYHDIARASNFLMKIGASVHLITDVVLSETELALEGVTGGVPCFHRIVSYLDLLILLPWIIPTHENKIIIYFSGHGEQESMILPNGDLFSFLSLRDHIIKLIDPYGELLFILDCCYPGAMNLPLVLQDRWRLTEGPKDFLTHYVLVLTSAQKMERAVATRDGSLFTSHLFQYLHGLFSGISTGRSWLQLITTLNRDLSESYAQRRLNVPDNSHTWRETPQQRVSLYSSHYLPLVLWSWIGCPLRYEVVVDVDGKEPMLRCNEYTSSDT